jgi:hypothetical protein
VESLVSWNVLEERRKKKKVTRWRGKSWKEGRKEERWIVSSRGEGE